MTQPPADILLRIERLLRLGKQEEARLLLMEFLRLNPSSARAWWLMSLTITDINQQMDCLERVLLLDPENELARERLEMLKNHPTLLPSVNPFIALETPEAEMNGAKRPLDNALPISALTGPTVAIPISESHLPAPEPTPASAPAPVLIEPAQKISVPRKLKKASRFAGVLIAILVICIISSLALYMWIQHQAQVKAAQVYNLQQTREVAQNLTSMPLPTLIPTWTASPTQTTLPTVTLTPTPTFTPTPQYTMSGTLRPSGLVGPVVGLYAPDFSLTDLTTGQEVKLVQFDGQPVLIIFFSTVCPHCKNEITAVESIYQTYKDDGLVLLAIDTAEYKTIVEAYRSTYQLTFPILLDPYSIAQATYRVNAVPRHFFIDTAGRISYIGLGEMTFAELKVQVEKILWLPPTSTP
jgi:peroxiredoxin